MDAISRCAKDIANRLDNKIRVTGYTNPTTGATTFFLYSGKLSDIANLKVATIKFTITDKRSLRKELKKYMDKNIKKLKLQIMLGEL